MGTPSSKTSGSTWGESWPLTEYGEPESMTPMNDDYMCQWHKKKRSRERTLWLPPEVLNLLRTWHEFGVYIELSTPPSD